VIGRVLHCLINRQHKRARGRLRLRAKTGRIAEGHQ
jgi:hypothetical protein